MSEVSLIVLMEAGQIRSLATTAFRIPLPDSLIWGPGVTSAIEAQTQEIDAWPSIDDVEAAVVIDRDQRQITLPRH